MIEEMYKVLRQNGTIIFCMVHQAGLHTAFLLEPILFSRFEFG